MPVVDTEDRRKYCRASTLILCEKDGAVVDLSAASSVTIEMIKNKISEMFVVGTDAEATLPGGGTDGIASYNPPVGGLTKNIGLVVWVITSSIPESYPASGEIEVRVSAPGSIDPMA